MSSHVIDHINKYWIDSFIWKYWWLQDQSSHCACNGENRPTQRKECYLLMLLASFNEMTQPLRHSVFVYSVNAGLALWLNEHSGLFCRCFLCALCHLLCVLRYPCVLPGDSARPVYQWRRNHMLEKSVSTFRG